MALGYGYVRDDDPVQINWSEITKNFTDRIKADQVDRQKRKDDIQEKFNDLQKDLINKPQGYNTDLNKVVGSFSGQASTASLDLINKLKSGQISEQEYYTKRANLKSSTENFFLYSKNFNDNYGRLMELARSNDPDKKLSAESIFQLQIASDMLDFKNTTAIVDPGTNELILVKTDENGNPTDQIVNVSQLGYLSSDEKLSYNYKNEISTNLKNRGVRKFTKDGKVITTIQGVEVDTETGEAAINGLAEAIVGDQSQMISILAQNGYTLTKDPSKKDDEKTMYYDMNTNEWSFDTEAALGIVTDEINNSISVEVKDELTTFQKANLENQKLNREESIRQFNIKIALDRERLGIESGNQEGVNSPLNIIQTTDGRQIAGNNYIRTISENNFKNFKNKKDVSINLTEVLKEADIPGVTITYTEGGQDVSPITDLVKSQGGLTNVPMGHFVTGSSSNPTIRTLETIDIFLPEIMDQPIRIPITETISEDIERVFTVIELRKKGGDKIIGNEINFIPFNEYYNPISRQEEVVEEVENESVNNSNRATGFNPD